MYHRTRWLHRWIGVTACIFLVIIATTGFLLATKGTFGWIRPPEAKAVVAASAAEIVSVGQVMNAVVAHGVPEIRSLKDVDRIDYRPKSNIFKVVSKTGYKEVQVDGRTGHVRQVAFRNDQLAEDIHDFSFFADAAHAYGLPAVALLLLFLALSGLGMFFVPVWRRYQFRKKGPGIRTKAS